MRCLLFLSAAYFLSLFCIGYSKELLFKIRKLRRDRGSGGMSNAPIKDDDNVDDEDVELWEENGGEVFLFPSD